MKRKTHILGGVAFIVLAISVFGFWSWQKSLSNYRTEALQTKTNLQDSLVFFERNTSQHTDAVSGCWYDAGDYLVFSPRTAEAAWYLSLAYKTTQNKSDKDALLQTLLPAINCVEEMDKMEHKQYRDARSHASRLPPELHMLVTPDSTYSYAPGEGRDIALFLSLIYTNLGNTSQADLWLNKARGRQQITKSEECCEEGPLMISETDMQALEFLAGLSTEPAYPSKAIWGGQLPAIAEILKGDPEKVKRVLSFVNDDWTPQAKSFTYIGGNYDIVGTNAMACLFEKRTGDKSFRKIASDLIDYIHGKNPYNQNFTALGDQIYHPCAWYNVCELPNTLVNGVDESGEFDLNRKDVWRISEVQTVGQAVYTLSEACTLSE